jgi:hypothetical protein
MAERPRPYSIVSQMLTIGNPPCRHSPHNALELVKITEHSLISGVYDVDGCCACCDRAGRPGRPRGSCSRREGGAPVTGRRSRSSSCAPSRRGVLSRCPRRISRSLSSWAFCQVGFPPAHLIPACWGTPCPESGTVTVLCLPCIVYDDWLVYCSPHSLKHSHYCLMNGVQKVCNDTSDCCGQSQY